jgi:Tfp pilus assembly PilM family ATPase
MFQFFQRNLRLGIEITTRAVRVVSLSGRGATRTVHSSASAELSAGVISGAYSSLNIADRAAFNETLAGCLPQREKNGRFRAGLCLPDGMFRVQILDFDEFPGKRPDQERLIRWRLQKAAAFDLTDTVLRYQALRRREKGFTVLVCIAKKQLVSEIEELLLQLGIEPWSLGISSFSALNFYAPYLSGRSVAYALAHIMGDSFATIIAEQGGSFFYRFKELRGSAEDAPARLLREIEDSLHFYHHMDRSQQSPVTHLYLTGEQGIGNALASSLGADGVLDVQVLEPSAVLGSGAGTETEMAAALGAGAAA